MSFEIERKFLVRNKIGSRLRTKHCDIRQAYLTIGGKASVRVRIRDNHTATVTVKSRPVELRRLELEYPIPMLEAEALMPLRQGSIVEKVRYRIPCGDLAWEIDVFSGENEGLVIAEIELAMNTSTSSCRPGSARKSPASRSTTTASWCSTRSAPGPSATRTSRSASGRDPLSLPVFGEGRVGLFLLLARFARGPHPTSLSLGHPPRSRGGISYSAATTRFPFVPRRASTGARNAPV